MTFVVGPGYAIFEGPAGDSRAHAHAAFQVLVASQGRVTLEDAAGLHRAPALLVPPTWRHRLHPAPWLRTVFVEPNCALADTLRGPAGGGITPAPFAAQWGDALLRTEGSRPSAVLDRRLQQAMALLSGGDEPMPAIARRCGLSPVHLRALAREQLGMPLARWRIWLRFRQAALSLGAGHTLAEAAVDAGFADQAHFSRCMREMFGVTPAAVLPVLRAQGRRAT